MKTILITGGANGLGKGVALHYLKNGKRVIAIGSSTVNGNTFLNEAKELNATDRAFYMQANLSLSHDSYNPENAKRLYSLTTELLKI